MSQTLKEIAKEVVINDIIELLRQLEVEELYDEKQKLESKYQLTDRPLKPYSEIIAEHKARKIAELKQRGIEYEPIGGEDEK